jgi:endoglucanase
MSPTIQRSVQTCSLLVFLFFTAAASAQNTFIRINQIGYRPSDMKIAITFSRTPLSDEFVLQHASNKQTLFHGPLRQVHASNWGGKFSYVYELDFSAFKQYPSLGGCTGDERLPKRLPARCTVK